MDPSNTNIKKLVRQSFHVINIGEIDNEYNPLNDSRSCINNVLNPMLKDIAIYHTENEQIKDSILNKFQKDHDFFNDIYKKVEEIEILFL